MTPQIIPQKRLADLNLPSRLFSHLPPLLLTDGPLQPRNQPRHDIPRKLHFRREPVQIAIDWLCQQNIPSEYPISINNRTLNLKTKTAKYMYTFCLLSAFIMVIPNLKYRYYLNALNANWHWCTSCTDTELLTLREEGEWSKNCAGSRTPKRLPYDRGLGLNFVAAYKAFFHLFNGRDV